MVSSSWGRLSDQLGTRHTGNINAPVPSVTQQSQCSKYKHTDSDSDNWGNVTKITPRRRAINRQDGFLENKETKTLETSDDIDWKI